MNKHKIIWALLIGLTLGCGLGPIQLQSAKPTLPTEIEPASTPQPPAAEQPQQTPENPEATAVPTAPPTPAATPLPTPTGYWFQSISTCPAGSPVDNSGNCCPHGYTIDDASGFCAFKPSQEVPPNVVPPTPRHGLLIALVLPLLCLGIPWAVAELYVVRYVQPKSLDLSSILIKAADGLFIEATISLTARKILGFASTRMTWPRVQEFAEKNLEPELVHKALSYETLADLEWNLKNIADGFNQLPIVRELVTDFGVELMRFNIETRYPLETMDALNKKAEASAGGTAYLAYAAAAHLDPDSSESRELYRVYEETKGNIDAARNLGSGLTNLAEMFTKGNQGSSSNDDNTS